MFLQKKYTRKKSVSEINLHVNQKRENKTI